MENLLQTIKDIRKSTTMSKYEKNNELYSIATNTDDPKALEVLSKISGGEIKMAVAENCDCPIELLEKLSKDRSTEVRKAVARNPITPHAILRSLAADNNTVKSWLAMNEALPADIAELLSFEKFKDTLYELLNNPNCPQSVRDRLGSIEQYKGKGFYGGYYTGSNYIR